MPYRLAVTIAGAVSLGSFEAGVLFELLDALAQHNQAAPPASRIALDVLTGASAGGMTAAIAAQTMLYAWPAVTDPYDNPFYNAWVAGVDIQGLLPLTVQESAGMSVFSSDFVQGVAQRFLLGRYSQLPPPQSTPHVEKVHRVILGDLNRISLNKLRRLLPGREKGLHAEADTPHSTHSSRWFYPSRHPASEPGRTLWLAHERCR